MGWARVRQARRRRSSLLTIPRAVGPVADGPFSDMGGKAHGTPSSYFNFAQRAWQVQVTRWSLTIPVACMKA